MNGAAAPVKNGTLMVMDATGTKLVLPTADNTTKLIAKEITTLYDGMPAVRFVVNKLNNAYYFVENGFTGNTAAEYDAREVETAVGAFLRAHPLTVGDEFVVATDLQATVGTAYGVLATGLIG